MNQELKIKVLNTKLGLYNDISAAKWQINYHIKNGAQSTLDIINKKLDKGKPERLQFEKSEYERIINYLECVKADKMHNYGNNKYLESYYEHIDIKTKILQQL